MRFAIFVDGPNMIGSLEKLNLKVEEYQAFFQHAFEAAFDVWKQSYLGTAVPPAKLLRVFWYQVGNMDELRLDDQGLINNLKIFYEASKDLTRNYCAIAGKDNPGKSQEEVKEIAWQMCLQEGKAWYEKKKTALEGMRRFNHAVRGNTDFVEIVESGHWKVDLLRKQVDEKGIDTALAVDLVTLLNGYDVAVLLSGDADMIPSLNYAKQQGKHVAVIDIIKGYPPESKGRQSSTRLKNASDFVVPIYEMSLVQKGIAKPKA